MPDAAELTSVAGRRTISLEEVLACAPATTRVDRKYVVPRAIAEELVTSLPPSLRVLAIGGRLSTAYRSTYFDTPDLMTCRAHIQQRRRRWKARSRLYVEDGLCRLELKVRDGSGLTRKYFHPTSTRAQGHLDQTSAAFFQGLLLDLGLPPAPALEASADIGYRRTTLADVDTGARVTVDLGLTGTRHRRTMSLDAGCAIVETKGGQTPGAADRLLMGLGARPVSFSKYAATVSLLDSRIPDNDVRHLVGHTLHLDTTPHHDLRRSA
ncbi:VTC domain-containing protein [Nocardioides sp. URHA0020]|uniref:VTC domain-containing protein n=1 Tax=Nocardioides sp. URHA0020 TaxID=1380392 RepID=UPI00068720D6|nr:VTC domain-containing protein [Nocardioides sp. URHA0020]